ncbi:EAL domain, c-di-GMP-specific phosphodiesterase class I (or its enzymatically inactive variant) [Parafrankia irregularis]|uniref:EAL domain, c-di-GMP-specific phosphodiesterase class I (Or its enzymatically inactive variant) n=1 Tax=Parafrankia irregularis TaxID=795642 RepID=A0A0S4QKI0_9ACTN|nr:MULTISPECIES: EAL domain-containing protein [Parafrankia]MBE3205502.1 EAL domain-containing protein [Parafrankia sp. CH37]CUU55602.1 EAL domain, c-di-GMP-specific phosphodiesterase class I (or its enzymatically inactive variant) [Parafrankia irregularis]
MTALDIGLVPALYASFDDGTLRLHYQPDVDLRSGSVPGMRAYPRWAHPELGLLGPADFMPVAAAAGLVGQVHQWVLRMAVTEARTWHRMAAGTGVRPPRLWVRVDSAQLGRPDFFDEIERLVLGRSLPPGAIGLQFTENTLAFAPPGLPHLLGRLRALGVAVGVDSFGTWSASVATLDKLPLDLVRIDGRFLRATIRDLEGQAVFASMLQIAHRRRMVVVAEDVDTAALAAAVGRTECDRVCGPLFCPPVPVEDARMIALGRGRPDRWYKPWTDSWEGVGTRRPTGEPSNPSSSASSADSAGFGSSAYSASSASSGNAANRAGPGSGHAGAAGRAGRRTPAGPPPAAPPRDPARACQDSQNGRPGSSGRGDRSRAATAG